MYIIFTKDLELFSKTYCQCNISNIIPETQAFHEKVDNNNISSISQVKNHMFFFSNLATYTMLCQSNVSFSSIFKICYRIFLNMILLQARVFICILQ